MKNKTKIAGSLLTLFVVPFIVLLGKSWKKGLNEPATMADLLVIFGVQLILVVLLFIKIYFFNFLTLG